MKGLFRRLVYSEYIKGSRSSRMLMCVWGNVCSLCVRRVIQKEDTKSFCIDTIRLDALLQ